jgi:Na+/H+ antiporter NhaD/arsenite permease-like protein
MPGPPTISATPLWAVLPFCLYLLLIATLPLFLGKFWEHNRNKLALALAVSTPVVIYVLGFQREGGALLFETARDYVAFMALLGALFVISGGIYVRGSFLGRPLVNAVFLLVGALLASVIGTTGASALLIRPLVRANTGRRHIQHVVVFFIFVVSNAGGLLTPLGDPPLFLGFLRGVPFTWTLRLAAPWALVIGTLLVVFTLVDRYLMRHEPRTRAIAPEAIEPLAIEGKWNLLWLGGVVATVFLVGTFGERLGGPSARALVQIGALALLGFLSLRTTPRRIHEENRFSWGPIEEVAVVFIGVFVTMVPALVFLQERGPSLGVTRPWQFFWASGALSSVLDNAPTYLTFASLATGVADHGSGTLVGHGLGALAAHPTGQTLLAAVSCGSVLMGAITYIGNGPNFMVKAIAEQHHVRMPSFFGYVLWSFAVLVPTFVVVGLVFF